MSTCSKASMISGDSSGKVPEGHCSAVGIPKLENISQKCFRQGQLIPVPLLQHYEPPLCSFSLGRKGVGHMEDSLLPAAPGTALPRLHTGVPPTHSVPLASLRSWAQHPPHSTRNHRCFCLFPLCPVGYFTRKCCWGFLVGKNWLLFWQERKCQAFKTVLKGKTVTTQSAQSTAARRNGLTALELLRHPTAANIPISQQNNQFNCGLSQQRRLKFRQAGSARSQRMRTVNVPSVSGW